MIIELNINNKIGWKICTTVKQLLIMVKFTLYEVKEQ